MKDKSGTKREVTLVPDKVEDKEGNVIESWMSATEAHVFEQKLIAGETYTLAEVTAPSGYEVAAELHLL